MTALVDPLGDLLDSLGLTEEVFAENLDSIKDQLAQGAGDVDLGEDSNGEAVMVTERTARQLLSAWNRQQHESEEAGRERMLTRWSKQAGDPIELIRRLEVRTESDEKLDAWASERY